METVGKRRRAQLPSIWNVENELDASIADERDQERRDHVMRQLMYSDEPADRLAIKAAAVGLVSYVQVEDMEYSSWYKHKKGWFGHTTDEEGNTKRIRRVVVER